ncbi:MAG: hypothetical protein FJ010_14330, partial [Chloroflexi bacterium]|nr:hypothetical protein [Chloroflexota bacterium]
MAIRRTGLEEPVLGVLPAPPVPRRGVCVCGIRRTSLEEPVLEEPVLGVLPAPPVPRGAHGATAATAASAASATGGASVASAAPAWKSRCLGSSQPGLFRSHPPRQPGRAGAGGSPSAAC